MTHDILPAVDGTSDYPIFQSEPKWTLWISIAHCGRTSQETEFQNTLIFAPIAI